MIAPAPLPKAAMPAPAWRRHALAGLAVAVLAAAGGVQTMGYLESRRAAQLLLHGEANLVVEAVRAALARGAPRPEEADGPLLTALVDEVRPLGVVAVGLVEADGEVSLESAPGLSPRRPRPDMRADELERVEDGAVRVLGGYPPPGRPRDGRDPDDRPPRAPRFPKVVVEFKPQWGARLEQSAALTGALGGALLLALAGLGLLALRLVRARDALVGAREADRHLRTLGEMSAVLAHELRNPLASLKGHAQLLAEALPSDGREHQQAGRVVHEAVRLEKLSTDLLAFARAGTCDRRPTDVAHLLREVAGELSADRIAVEAPPGPLMRAVDPVGLHRVLSNLLQNALEASPPGASVEASVAADGLGTRFCVRDRGPGVPPDARERIFEPFHTDKLHGTGLGLAVARRIAALHGGSVEVQNGPDGGAIFEVRLPAA